MLPKYIFVHIIYINMHSIYIYVDMYTCYAELIEIVCLHFMQFSNYIEIYFETKLKLK